MGNNAKNKNSTLDTAYLEQEEILNTCYIQLINRYSIDCLKPAAHEDFSLYLLLGWIGSVCNLEACRGRNDVTAGCLSG